MTGWLIFGGIILFILGVFMIPVHIAADYKDEFSLEVKFLFFFKLRVFPMKKKEEKEEKQEKKKTEKTETKEKPKKQKRKKTPDEIIDMIIDAVNKYGPGAKMILRNIRFHRLELYWKVCAEDAAACGIKYGKICAWLSGVFGFFRNLMKIEKAKLRVFPDFISEKDEIYGGADIEFNPLIIIIGALKMALVFVRDMLNKANKQKKRRRAMQKRQNIKAKENA